jgi:hypothetical protein
VVKTKSVEFMPIGLSFCLRPQRRRLFLLRTLHQGPVRHGKQWTDGFSWNEIL